LSSVQVPVTAIATEERVLDSEARCINQPRLHSGLNLKMLPKISYRLRCATSACRNRSQRDILDMSLCLSLNRIS